MLNQNSLSFGWLHVFVRAAHLCMGPYKNNKKAYTKVAVSRQIGHSCVISVTFISASSRGPVDWSRCVASPSEEKMHKMRLYRYRRQWVVSQTVNQRSLSPNQESVLLRLCVWECRLCMSKGESACLSLTIHIASRPSIYFHHHPIPHLHE